ncbi:hypothetical protein FYK55_26640 [Roseiconus nitratireducens]|uniref:Uncharacterized protein n=1 Tax=Roseiconus nitratireducens TaxID=2605748 RepID=A0A5M6CTZ0_9BACT|nr:CehA/McbA family metallohydrolase [Roseiconus nitratireducens]KAA5538694.1 hypothetical protein FYK55_26640 [Roseiconus nitratireducens]
MSFSRLIATLLAFGIAGLAVAQPMPHCVDESCHTLDASVTVDRQHLDELLQSLDSVDGALADKIRQQVADDADDLKTVLDRFSLIHVSINAESRVKVDEGAADPLLPSGRWGTFLIRVQNLAGVTAPLRLHCDQQRQPNRELARDRWVEIEVIDDESLPRVLSGTPLEYRIVRFRTDQVGTRSALCAIDVGQGTADIGFRNDVLLTFNCQADLANARPASSQADLRRWLENMVWHHRYSQAEIRAATGLTPKAIRAALKKFDLRVDNRPERGPDADLLVLPYPGGRHPRTGFLDGAINPQRDTKVSVFTPWDPNSYVVVDVPEAIWSNLGLTYLAHTHIPTIWDQREQHLDRTEWDRQQDGSLTMSRTLPNGIAFGTVVKPTRQSVRMEMWLTNGTDQVLTGLRVQNCVMLKAAKQFSAQTNENKIHWGPYAACRNANGDRWVITAWDPVDRAWGNDRCPCLHSDPKFPDCRPGQTQRLRGWLSFYSGDEIYQELLRIEQSGWRVPEKEEVRLVGAVFDERTGKPIPSRIHLRDANGAWKLVQSVGGDAIHYDRRPPRMAGSSEVHTTLTADPFSVALPAGRYTIRVERGKEYLPVEETLEVGGESVTRQFRLRRWANLAERGWYSGDTHLHRSLDELPNAMLAEDLNVTFPLTYWVTRAGQTPDSPRAARPVPDKLIQVDPTHVIYPVNTEYEIAQVSGRRQTLGAVFVLNHRQPLQLAAPPVRPVARLARDQDALLDLDKHSWPWSLMIAPVMEVDLFELSNNHVWQTRFGFKDWTSGTDAEYMDVEKDEDGFSESGWIDYGFQTYYALLNCGLRMRVSAGTASGVHPVQIGFSRVYVHVPGQFSYQKWIRGLDAGRSFVTNGPMLDVRFNGRHAGETFSTESGGQTRIAVTGQCESRRPLERIEIVVNGIVRQSVSPQNLPLEDGGYLTRLDVSVDDPDSYWVAVRCFEKHPSGRVRFAHTNPVYMDIPDRPLIPRREQVDYLVNRVSKVMGELRGVLSDEALEEYGQAVEFYRQKLEAAR